jgi:hypothetical protein
VLLLASVNAHHLLISGMIQVPPLQDNHPSDALGISYLKIVSTEETLISTSEKLSAVLGYPPSQSNGEYLWSTQANHSTDKISTTTSRLILSTAKTAEEQIFLSEKGPGVYEVSFNVGQHGKPGTVTTPYARIIFSRD